ncbi:MAG: flagellar biosynthesis anti-sigma factor FlgM [Thermodesulfobacteriota bacterium]
MKIGGKKGPGTDNFIKKTNGNGQLNRPGGSPAGPSGQGGDSVALSPKAKELNRAKSLLAEVPEVRGEMVVKLKTDIERGNYEVDAGKVAEKMIERALIDTIHAKK